MTAFASAAFATTVRVINRVHDRTTDCRTDALPAHTTCFTFNTEVVL